MKSPVFVTGNLSKVHWVERFLGFSLEHQHLDIDEIQDLDPEVVLKAKAMAAYDVIKRPVLVEDTSLTCHAIGRLPGTFIKYFLGELGNDGICKMIAGYEDNSASATVIFGLYDGQEFHAFKGVTSGHISTEPRGDSGHGWDPIFIPTGQSKTFGEMNEDEYEVYSARKKAVVDLKEYLN